MQEYTIHDKTCGSYTNLNIDMLNFSPSYHKQKKNENISFF